MSDKNAKETQGQNRLIAQNRKARYEFAIGETFEAGLVLVGTEVKSLREGKASLTETFAGTMSSLGGEELFLFNMHIAEYGKAGRYLQHEPRRPRKLLLHRKQINKILGAISRKGMALVALSIYFNAKGRIKISLGLAEGKKLSDKREAEKERDWDRQKARLVNRTHD